MRNQIPVTAPLIVACGALLLCIGVIAGLTGAVIMQSSNSGRPAPVATPANTGGATVQASPMANAPVPVAPAANTAITTPLPAVPEVAAAILEQQRQQQQGAPVVANPIVPPAAVTAFPAPPMPAAEAIQPPDAPAQEAPPVVGDVTSAAEAQGDEVDPATFQEDLQPMGQWVATPDYGNCWVPQGVPVGWRPYAAGRWVYTECGWTWVSEEPWGHITYHYGSWVDYPGHGWIWVPGRVWAPAWVAWRVGGGYVGWAPLPPAACRRDIPVATAVVLRIPTPYYCFVGERDFCDDHVGRRMRPIHDNVTIIVQTRNSTRIDFGRTTVVNRSLTIEQVQGMTGRRPPQVHLERSDNSRDADQRREHGEPVAYHPRPKPAAPAPGTPRDRNDQNPPSGPPSASTPWPTPRTNRVTPTPVVRPADPTPGKPDGQPTPKPPKTGSTPWLPLPSQQGVSAPENPKPPVARPAGPEPRKPDPQPTPTNGKRPAIGSAPTNLPLPRQPSGTDKKPVPAPPTAVRPAGPEPRPADAQPAPKPTRDRGNSDAPAADKPTAPPAARPADPPKRQADPDPTPAPEKRRERAPEPASPPPAARPADPAPARPTPPPAPAEAPQRRQPAPANNVTDDQTNTPGQAPGNSGGAGNGRRGGR